MAEIKKHFINLKPRLISPIFEYVYLKSRKKAFQRTLFCPDFDGFTLHYAADLVLFRLKIFNKLFLSFKATLRQFFELRNETVYAIGFSCQVTLGQGLTPDSLPSKGSR